MTENPFSNPRRLRFLIALGNLSLFMLLSFPLSSCVSTIQMSPVAKPNQSITYRDGVPVIASGNNTKIEASPKANNRQSGERVKFYFSVYNGSTNPVNFSTENIIAKVDGKDLKVFSFDELVAETEKQRRSNALAVALLGVAQSINAANAGNQYTTSTYKTNYYGNKGYAGSSYGTYTSHTYDPAVAAAAQAQVNAQTSRNLREINASAEARLSHLSNTILKKETVYPNTWYGGLVEIEESPIPEKSNILSLNVIFAGEEAVFDFTQTKAK